MKGIGTDIVQIARIKQVYDRQGMRFVRRLLTQEEQKCFEARGQSITYLANRFAAKEAISKALGTGIAKGIRFTDMEVLANLDGAPSVTLSGKAEEHLVALGGHQIMVSLSDEKEYAVAFAVVL
ncbi:MAG: holo-ACP synthase [Reinekea sp.]